jgi:hypothetical protein
LTNTGSIEFPTVVTALDALSVKTAVGQRNAPMRAIITQRKWFTVSCASKNDVFA